MNKVTLPSLGVTLEVEPGASLLETLRHAGVDLESPCDGSGTCGKCRVKLAAHERAHVRESAHDLLSDAEREEGFVLACQASICGDLEIETDAANAEGEGLRILSEGHGLDVALEPWISKTFDPATASTRILAGNTLLGVEPGDTTGRLYGLAIDIGTTTLVAALVDLRTGCELATASSLNPQARYGQDVLSRIKLGSAPDGLAKLQGDLIAELNRHAADAAAQAGVDPRDIYEAVFSGNTTMLYLAVGTDPATLGKYPYTLTRRGAEHVGATGIGLEISPLGLVYLPPVMSAYVGADITSGILAADLPHTKGVVLFVDIGTNGEMVLGIDGKLTATSTAAGPAFEGMNITCGMRAGRGAVERVSLSDDGLAFATIGSTEPSGLCGSGLLDVVGELAAHGGVDKNGRFQHNGTAPDKPWKSQWERVDGKPVFRITGPVYLSQKDVRQVQLAKAAIRAGIELMLKENGLTPARVDRVLIAGSFGFHLRTESLINLGLLPRAFAGRVEFVGNTSRTGAQALLLNHPARGRLARVAGTVNVLELANNPAFETTFLQSLAF
ncbi:MAG: ASKHA domain-containing protein [Chthoniobacteraceae bacterium]|nr:ASKHA domain-containing protein [Chthoniobacteraceae bacterium]